MKTIYNYINGQLVPAASGHTIEVYNPSTGKVYASAPDSDGSDVEAAYQAAKEAFSSWSKLSIEVRSDYLMKISNKIEENFKFFAQAITQFASESHDMGTAINYTLRQPLGVVGCISPWNLPLYLFSWKIAPALAAGNTVVAKPSEITPMTAYLLTEICKEVGLPDGVLNVVHGLGHKVGAVMTAHPRIKAISFTGSTRVGGEIAKVAAPMFKKLSLEMGGKNPNIIFADCDYDKMLKMTVNSSFSNQGQICLCGSRIYVERSIYD